MVNCCRSFLGSKLPLLMGDSFREYKGSRDILAVEEYAVYSIPTLYDKARNCGAPA
jgi:hypothetical protein